LYREQPKEGLRNCVDRSGKYGGCRGGGCVYGGSRGDCGFVVVIVAAVAVIVMMVA
jgi:hypothetical protein